MISGYAGRSPRSWIWRVVSNPIKRCEVLEGNLLGAYSPASTRFLDLERDKSTLDGLSLASSLCNTL